MDRLRMVWARVAGILKQIWDAGRRKDDTVTAFDAFGEDNLQEQYDELVPLAAGTMIKELTQGEIYDVLAELKFSLVTGDLPRFDADDLAGKALSDRLYFEALQEVIEQVKRDWGGYHHTLRQAAGVDDGLQPARTSHRSPAHVLNDGSKLGSELGSGGPEGSPPNALGASSDKNKILNAPDDDVNIYILQTLDLESLVAFLVKRGHSRKEAWAAAMSLVMSQQ